MKDVILGALIGLAILAAIISPFVWLIYHLDGKEVKPDEYKQMRDWAKKYPHLQPMVKEAKWSDDIISRSEFKEIGKAADKFEIEQYFQEAIGE